MGDLLRAAGFPAFAGSLAQMLKALESMSQLCFAGPRSGTKLMVAVMSANNFWPPPLGRKALAFPLLCPAVANCVLPEACWRAAELGQLRKRRQEGGLPRKWLADGRWPPALGAVHGRCGLFP